MKAISCPTSQVTDVIKIKLKYAQKKKKGSTKPLHRNKTFEN